ncbi:MAG TPA: class E sortase [Solirubrobacteraceae bacterium]|nr:class E sortase [Solirubrobacteraceae bacterium]
MSATRTRRFPARRLIRDLSSVLILSGLLLVLDAGVTLVWQEPVTAAIGLIMRGQVNQRYLSYRTAPLTGPDVKALHTIKPLSQRIAYLARRERAQITTGDAIGQIEIPRIGNTYNVVQGTDTSSLEEGPGHYPETALPGMGQTVAIAGHRTTYLAPFRYLNQLTSGDRIFVTMPYGKFTYVVQYQRIVKPTQVSVIDNVGYDRLVLSACNPLYSAAQRIIIFARLKSVQPLGPARAAKA